MACRLVNLHDQPLRVDLRGGETLVLAPGSVSAVLREELLYDNVHLAGWEEAGWLARTPARLADAEAQPGAAAAKPLAPAGGKRKREGGAPAEQPAEKGELPPGTAGGPAPQPQGESPGAGAGGSEPPR